MLDEDRYETLQESDGPRVLDIPHDARRLIVSYSPVRAEKDRRDRDQVIAVLAVERVFNKINQLAI